MTILVIIALLVGGGTSVAAQSALPGDVLYPVKVNVNENVQGWFAVSSEAKATWNANRAENRLTEAEKLSAEGRLDATTGADLQARFDAAIQAFKDSEAKIEADQSANANAAADSDNESNFEADLQAHAQLLSAINTNSAEARAQLAGLLAKVNLGITAAAEARANAEAKITAGANVQTAAEGKMNAAKNKIDEVKSYIAAHTSVSADVAARANARIQAADAAYAAGNASLNSKNYAQAFMNFQAAMRYAQQAKLIVSTEDTLKIDLNLGGSSNANDNGANGQINVNVGGSASTNGGTSTSGTTSGTQSSSGTKVQGSGSVKVGL